MKSIFRLSFIPIVALLFMIQLAGTSCTKETLVQEKIVRDTVVVKDTVRMGDTILTAQILTAHPWKLQELRGLKANTKDYYVRGGTGNINNYDNEYITFNADKTGSYVEPSGTQHTLTWDLQTTPGMKLTYNIANLGTQASTIINWENVLYKNNNITYDEYYTQGSNNSQAHAVRMPK